MPSVSLPMAGFPADAPTPARGQAAGRQGGSAAGGTMTDAASRDAFEAALAAARGGARPADSRAASSNGDAQDTADLADGAKTTGAPESESLEGSPSDGETFASLSGESLVDPDESNPDPSGDATVEAAAAITVPATPEAETPPGAGAPAPQAARSDATRAESAPPAGDAASPAPIEPAGPQASAEDKPAMNKAAGAGTMKGEADGRAGAAIAPPSSSTKSLPAGEPAPSPDATRAAVTGNSDAKPEASAKTGDAAAAQAVKTASEAQAATPPARSAASEPTEKPTAQPADNATTRDPGAPAAKADASGAKAAQDIPAKAALETGAQGLSGLKADPDAAREMSRRASETPAAQRAAFGQAGSDKAVRGTGEPDRAQSATPSPVASAAPSAGAAPSSRPLADLIALQLLTATQGAPLVLEAEASPDTALSFDGESGLETGQTRTDARADAVRLPGQAGQAARFTPQTVQHLAGRMAQSAADGGRTLDIRLDPAELGRVRVRLEMGADNSVRAYLSAERPDTLAELQRTARDLEKALEDAGLDLAENGLEFSLSQDGDDTAGERRGAFTPIFAETEILTDAGAARSGPTIPETLYGFALSERTRLDVRI